MAIKLLLGGANVTETLIEPPEIRDELNNNCCILTFTVQHSNDPQDFKGLTAECYVNEKRWFYGTVREQTDTEKGDTKIKVYDPLFNFSRYTDDFYFKTQTATQIFIAVGEKANVPLGSIANTEAVFPHLWYPGAKTEKVCIDVLARTKLANGRKFWYRVNPETGNIDMFERTVPTKLWVFKVGQNLTAATRTSSVTDIFTSVKLINRDTGQVVIKTNDSISDKYNLHTQHFEEISDEDIDLNTKASEILEQKSTLKPSMSIEGINSGGQMGRLFSGDAVYVEEPNTGIIGGYYIRNVTHVLESADLITLSMDIVAAPDLPEIQYDDATKTTTETGTTKESKKDSEITVYVQPDGKIYHKEGCPVITDCSCTSMSKEAAKKKNALQCAVCKA